MGVASFYPAAQVVSSVQVPVMVHASAHCPAVTTVNVDNFVKSFHVAMGANATIFSAAYHAATMPSVTFVNAFKDANFATVYKDAKFVNV